MADAPLLQVTGLEKSYNVPVLTDFNFDLHRGEVHALVGSNGAGKSTFARILCGLTQPDRGEIRFDGRDHRPSSKREAEHAGVIMVLQELNVIPTLTIAENIFLNRLPRSGGLIRYNDLHRRAARALARAGLEGVDPSTPAGLLGVGHQQLVEIAGALSQDCKLLILDEPTAALSDPEIDKLFENVLRLQSEGVGIIYVSHRMDEIRRIADRITVLRDGRRVATHEVGEVTSNQIVREMAGHDLPERKQTSTRASGEVALRVMNLRAGNRVRGVTFEARRGEILGIAGLIGSGRTETLRAVFGADPKQSGEILINGKLVHIKGPKDAVKAGLALIPEDRKQHGLLLSRSIRVNTTLASIFKHARLGWLNEDAESKTASSQAQQLKTRCHTIEQPVSELSGGNQQKVVIARWLARDCDILLFDEPTRGIDVAAKDTIYELLRGLAAHGKAVVIVSSELVELMALCDRIAVMSDGYIAAEFLPGEWSQEKITKAAFSSYLTEKEGASAL
jgi:ribose transport system ATP-binding protein